MVWCGDGVMEGAVEGHWDAASHGGQPVVVRGQGPGQAHLPLVTSEFSSKIDFTPRMFKKIGGRKQVLTGMTRCILCPRPWAFRDE